MRAIKITLAGILGIICAFTLFLLGLVVWNVGVVLNVNRVSEATFVLPGSDDKNFDMQSIAWDEEAEVFLFSGYMRHKEASPVYRMALGETAARIDLLRSDGTPLVSHAGGIAISGDYVYVAGSVDDCLYVFSRSELLNADDGGSVRSIGTFKTALSKKDGLKPALLTVADGKLFVGEFHFPILPWFKLRKNHRIRQTYAIMACFEIDPEKPLGLCETPCEVYYLPDMAQGVAVKDGVIYLSRSFFLFPSEIGRYQPVADGCMKLLGAEVPAYSLKKIKSVRMPPFSEEIEFLDGNLYISTEISYYFPAWIYNMWDGSKCRRIPADKLSS